MNEYVLGFLFNEPADAVLLMKKLRPEWQAGFLNGIGGKVEPGEPPAGAMVRECEEETGLTGINWHYRAFMRGANDDGEKFRCHVFYAYNNDVWDYQQIEDEPLMVYSVWNIPKKTVTCLNYLIPFGSCIEKFRDQNNPRFMTLDY